MVMIEFGDLIEFLCHTPGLKKLSLMDTCMTEGLFQLFTFDPTPSSLLLSLPQLTCFSLARDLTNALDGDAMVLMIESLKEYRSHGSSSFPSISIIEILIHGVRFSGDVEGCLKHLCRRLSGERICALQSWNLLGEDYFEYVNGQRSLQQANCHPSSGSESADERSEDDEEGEEEEDDDDANDESLEEDS
ncbi:hypothetical protein C8F04DRAFT_1172418 [Mycena alexandri]|uniref:Uncharacterized protein n=1 Tax=Mycena alexandri TaxID=1745969 RepID=A0AAD6TJU8_9AGAR|nr:hypothetical protein C8F04DRAFT_1172418 [Mycena alexandri]